MRSTCLLCTRKHLAKAYLNLCQLPVNITTLTGDEHKHFWLAIANLDEAEEESILEYPGLTSIIRETLRVPLMEHITNIQGFLVIARDYILNTITEIDKGSDKFLKGESFHCLPPLKIDSAPFHIAKASILVKEAFTGYPSHIVSAIAQLDLVKSQCEGLDKAAVAMVIDKLLKREPVNVFGLIDRFI